MAKSQNFNEMYVVEGDVDDVYQNVLTVLTSFSGTTGYQVNGIRPSAIILTRKYRPTWVWVVAILGLVFFLIGLLALFYSVNETVTINLRANKKTTQIDIGGMGNAEILTVFNSAIANYKRAERP